MYTRLTVTSQTPKDHKTILAENIRSARRDQNLTQRQLAAMVNGVDPQAVSRWERAESVPLPEHLTALAVVLGRDYGWLYTDHEEVAA